MSNLPAVKKTSEMNFPEMLDTFKGEIARALPKHLSADRMCRIALTEFRKNENLAKCDPRSVFAAIIQSSQLGLEVGLMGEASLVPFGKECQLIPGYTGLMKLATNTGKVKDIYAHEVRENDFFELTFGLERSLKHIPLQSKGGFPASDETRGPVVGYYAVGVLADDSRTFQALSIQDVEKIRNNSNGYKYAVANKKKSTWIDYPIEMGKKTVIRRLCKYLPKSPELMAAIALDTVHEIGGSQALTVDDAINGTWAPDYSDGAINADFQTVSSDIDENFTIAFNDTVKAMSVSFPELDKFVDELAKKYKTPPEKVKAGAMEDPAKFIAHFKKFVAKSAPKPEPTPAKEPEAKPPILCPAHKRGVFPDECAACDESRNPDGICTAFQDYNFDQAAG